MEVTLRKDYHLVLSFDTPNEELQGTFLDIMKSAGRDIHAAAMLAHGAVQDGGGAPGVTLYSDDFLKGKEDHAMEHEEAQRNQGNDGNG